MIFQNCDTVVLDSHHDFCLPPLRTSAPGLCKRLRFLQYSVSKVDIFPNCISDCVPIKFNRLNHFGAFCIQFLYAFDFVNYLLNKSVRFRFVIKTFFNSKGFYGFKGAAEAAAGSGSRYNNSGRSM